MIALNRLDEAREKGIYINIPALSEALGVPVVPTVAHMGKGIAGLFEDRPRNPAGGDLPLPQSPGAHLRQALAPLERSSGCRPWGRLPGARTLLLTQLARATPGSAPRWSAAFPALVPAIEGPRRGRRQLPRPSPKNSSPTATYRAAVLHERVTQLGHAAERGGWKRALDRSSCTRAGA